jgi:chorismate dehydratase
MRMAAIHFLNPAPLMWDFEHEPRRSDLRERYQIGYTTPSRCARELAAGEADIGLVPVAAHATTPSLLIVPGCAIAALDRVRSIILVVRPEHGSARYELSPQTLLRGPPMLTPASCSTSFGRFRQCFVPHPPVLESMLAVADAALLIGDPALLALEDREAREARTGERLLYLDLAHEWHGFTGLPWVSAFWAVRSGALEETGARAADMIADLQASRDHGLAHVDDLAEEWSERIAVPRDTIRFYLSSNIHYILDEACLRGLDLFYQLAAECGALPPASALTIL